MAKVRRKAWTQESMEAAVEACTSESKGLRESSRTFNVPVETLRRRVNGMVPVNCRPGPKPVLSEEEEEQLSKYCVEMADLGFGLQHDDVQRLAYQIAERSGHKHPFTDGSAGRGWFEGFRSRHSNLTLRTPQSLSVAMSMLSPIFLVNLARYVVGLISSISPCKYSTLTKQVLILCTRLEKLSLICHLSAAEKGTTHTLVSCVSLPPMMIFPRKKCVPDKFQEGAPSGTLFAVSDNGWITGDLYLQWFEFPLSDQFKI